MAQLAQGGGPSSRSPGAVANQAAMIAAGKGAGGKPAGKGGRLGTAGISDMATTAATAAFAATTTAFSNMSKQAMKNSIQQMALNSHLQSMGGTREEIKSINDLINQLVKISQVKQENVGDKIAMLKRVEIKLNEIVELRKVFGFFDAEGLAVQEHRMRVKAKNDRVAQA